MWIGDIIEKLENKAFTINGITYYPAEDVINELNVLSRQCVRWLPEDFETMAAEQYDEKSWRNYYDETKFVTALENMVSNINNELGVTWDTLKYYLDHYCKRSKAEIARLTNDDEIEI